MSRYHGFMATKAFHPGTYENQKKLWMAQQAEADKQRNEELARAEIQREFEHEQLAGLKQGSKNSKETDAVRKHMDIFYKPPPGFQNPDDKKDSVEKPSETDDRFKDAPRESYLKGQQIRSQPFGKEVRSIRCVKCKQWGHAMGERECPMKGIDKMYSGEDPAKLEDPLEVMKRMEEGGLRLKTFDRVVDKSAANQQLVFDDDAAEIKDDDVKWLETLSKKQKKRLLKELELHEGGGGVGGGVGGSSSSSSSSMPSEYFVEVDHHEDEKNKRKSKKSSKKSSKRHSKKSSTSSSVASKKMRKAKSKKRAHSSSDEGSDSDSSSSSSSSNGD